MSRRINPGRRAFLVLGAGMIGGCVRSSVPGRNETAALSDEPPPTMVDEPTEETETAVASRPETNATTTGRGDAGIGIDSDRSEPQTTAIIGDTDSFGDETDTITVWNDAEAVRRITVAVAEQKSDTLFRETYRFEPDAYVLIGISNPGEYTVTVGVNERKTTSTGFKTDDCNIQSLFATVTENGTVRSNSISTTMACNMTDATTSTDDG